MKNNSSLSRLAVISSVLLVAGCKKQTPQDEWVKFAEKRINEITADVQRVIKEGEVIDSPDLNEYPINGKVTQASMLVLETKRGQKVEGATCSDGQVKGCDHVVIDQKTIGPITKVERLNESFFLNSSVEGKVSGFVGIPYGTEDKSSVEFTLKEGSSECKLVGQGTVREQEFIVPARICSQLIKRLEAVTRETFALKPTRKKRT